MSVRNGVVYIVEDDPSFRTSLERLLHALGFETIVFETADTFLTEPAIRRPACLLLDVMLPDMDGLDLQQALIERGCSLPIIFMTGHGNIQMSVHAMKEGAMDFLPKPLEVEDLQAAILGALERDIQNTEKEARANHARSLIGTLTPREKEVMRWVIAGKPNKQIAFALGTTEKTIKVHRSRVMEKNKVSSVAELVRLAELAGILPAV